MDTDKYLPRVSAQLDAAAMAWALVQRVVVDHPVTVVKQVEDTTPVNEQVSQKESIRSTLLSDPAVYKAAMAGTLTGRLWLSLNPSWATKDIHYLLKTLWQSGVLDEMVSEHGIRAVDKLYQLSPPFRGLPAVKNPRGILMPAVMQAAIAGTLTLVYWNSLPTASRHSVAGGILNQLEKTGVLEVVKIQDKIRFFRLHPFFAKNFYRPQPPASVSTPAPPPLTQPQAPVITWEMVGETLTNSLGQAFRAGDIGTLQGAFRAVIETVALSAGMPVIEIATIGGQAKMTLGSRDIATFVLDPTSASKPTSKEVKSAA